MSAIRLTPTVVAVLIAGALTTGCGTVQPQPSVTKEQAVERVAARAQEAFQQLPPGATLKTQRHEPNMPCDNGPTDRSTFVETDYTVEYPQGWPVEQTISTLATYWTSHGYKVVKDDRTRDRLPELVVERPEDGFRIGIQLTYRDNGRIDAFLISSSPCL